MSRMATHQTRSVDVGMLESVDAIGTFKHINYRYHFGLGVDNGIKRF